MNSTNLPYGSGSVINVPQNTLHPYCARRYRGNNRNGNPLYTIVGYYETYEEARGALADARCQSTEDLSRADMTFREVFDHFMASRDDLSANTKKAYRGTARKYCSQLMDVRYRDVGADDMREAIRLAPSTNMKRAVKGVFAALDREAEILDIPGKRYAQLLQIIRRKQTDARPNRVPFSDEEMQRFLAHRDDRDMYIVLFLCYTGFRQGAFRTILKENVDLEKMTVTGGIKTQAGYMREIPLHPVVQPYVRRLMQKPGEYLLANDRAEAMGENELYARFQMAIAPYTDRHFVLHECRHTFRNKLDELKVEEYIICALMGHEMPTAGQRHYAKVGIQKKRDAIMRLWDGRLDSCASEAPAGPAGRKAWQKDRWRTGWTASAASAGMASAGTAERLQRAGESGGRKAGRGCDGAATPSCPTLRQLFEAYMAENPSSFGEDLRFRLRSASGHLRAVMDLGYDEITDEMLDACLDRAKSDLSKTELAFLVREFDRATQVGHALAYNRQMCE